MSLEVFLLDNTGLIMCYCCLLLIWKCAIVCYYNSDYCTVIATLELCNRIWQLSCQSLVLQPCRLTRCQHRSPVLEFLITPGFLEISLGCWFVEIFEIRLYTVGKFYFWLFLIIGNELQGSGYCPLSVYISLCKTISVASYFFLYFQRNRILLR